MLIMQTSTADSPSTSVGTDAVRKQGDLAEDDNGIVNTNRPDNPKPNVQVNPQGDVEDLLENPGENPPEAPQENPQEIEEKPYATYILIFTTILLVGALLSFGYVLRSHWNESDSRTVCCLYT